MDPALLATGGLWYLVLLFSITFHEAAHSFVGAKGGDTTAASEGFATMDPRPHLSRSPFGMIFLPILTFMYSLDSGSPYMMGMASVPYSVVWGQRNPKWKAVMSAAGPAANLILVAIAIVAIKIGIAQDFFYIPNHINFSNIVATRDESLQALAVIASITLNLNLILFVFNLLPVYPLDGAGVLTGLAGPEFAQKYDEFFAQPMMWMVGILIAWNLFPFLFSPIYSWTVALVF